MIAFHQDIAKHVQNKFVLEIENQRKSALFELTKLKKSRVQLSTAEDMYLDLIIDQFKKNNILTSTPQEISALKTHIGNLPACSRKPRKLKPFKTILIEKLNYSGLRKSFYPKYFNKLGIKACVYCNSVLTVSIEDTNSKFSARFDVDHYDPKDEFPYLSIFLFNLYPTCAPCNRRKSKSTSVNFRLYSDVLKDTENSVYKFELDKGSLSKFLLSKDSEDLRFSFQPNINTLQSAFRIKELYETQKDIIEELIVKQAMYDKYNRINLNNSFSKLNLHPDLYLRTLIGNYIKESEIHKRPMAKFMQDIARDLGIID